jgi:hypothetical protein
MLAGHANCCGIMKMTSQCFPPDHLYQTSHPGVSKSEQICCAGFDMHRLVSLGNVLRTHEF